MVTSIVGITSMEAVWISAGARRWLAGALLLCLVACLMVRPAAAFRRCATETRACWYIVVWVHPYGRRLSFNDVSRVVILPGSSFGF